MTSVMVFPTIDPVLIKVGAFELRWYALAYIVGILIGWRYARALANTLPGGPSSIDIDDFIPWATLGIVIGGRIGYVLFYKFDYYLASPLEILFVWRGGMSFHGGMLGVVFSIVAFTKRRRISLLKLSDCVSCAAPIGLFFGRIANFINSELYGRVTNVPWAIIFPTDPSQLPRHPSQLYQATLEGLALFSILWILGSTTSVRRKIGSLTGVFLIFYGVLRIVGELFRSPDEHIGFLVGELTMGQILSVPMVVAGIWLVVRTRSMHAPRTEVYKNK